jgi:dTDP-glucose 4,6-dehydratase
LVRKICDFIKVDFSDLVKDSEESLGKDQSYMLNSNKIRTKLSWKNNIGLEKGIISTIEWVDRNLDILKNLPHEYIHKV